MSRKESSYTSSPPPQNKRFAKPIVMNCSPMDTSFSSKKSLPPPLPPSNPVIVPLSPPHSNHVIIPLSLPSAFVDAHANSSSPRSTNNVRADNVIEMIINRHIKRKRKSFSELEMEMFSRNRRSNRKDVDNPEYADIEDHEVFMGMENEYGDDDNALVGTPVKSIVPNLDLYHIPPPVHSTPESARLSYSSSFSSSSSKNPNSKGTSSSIRSSSSRQAHFLVSAMDVIFLTKTLQLYISY